MGNNINKEDILIQNNNFIATHKVSFYGLPCWFNDKTDEIMCVNKYFNWTIDVLAELHNLFAVISFADIEGFPLKITEHYKSGKEITR